MTGTFIYCILNLKYLKSSVILIVILQTDFSFSLKPKPTRVISKTEKEDQQIAIYNLKGNGEALKLSHILYFGLYLIA